MRLQYVRQRKFVKLVVAKMAYGYVINFLLQIILGYGYWIGLKEIHLEINLQNLLGVTFGKEIHMSNASKYLRMTIVVRTGVCVLVAFLINRVTPLFLHAYECRSHGHPVIILTEYAIHQLPNVLVLLSLGMLMEMFFLRRRNLARSRLGGVLSCFFVICCILYLVGIMLSFIRYDVALW